ncbi:MAG: glutamate-5-semialdehyde dehydrogenase [Alphaproteobacteria bacterium]|nr:glutamate-5-semialdehyde dehydrogenase [Alphaproteobacteria bacterium]
MLRAEASDIQAIMAALGARARGAAAILATATGEQKDRALHAAAAAIRRERARLMDANQQDIALARDLSAALLDRLKLDDNRIEAMARGLEDVAALPDPIGTVIARWTPPNGLDISRVRVPLGVVGIIYESRPNVTADAGGLCLKSGNAAILRGGSESFLTSGVIVECLQEGLKKAKLPNEAIQRVPTRDRAAVGVMLTMRDAIDVIVPRGGRSLIERVQAEARMPVIGHLEGICHVYVDRAADLAMARRVVVNSKMRRTGVCGAAETLLVDRSIAGSCLQAILDDLIAAGCAVRGDAAVRKIDSRATPASEADWRTEYLDAVIAVALVDGVEGAIEHINRHGSHHTEAIVTEDSATAERFFRQVDSAILLHNASTQFADGGEFGMGAEIGISTDKFHARGPVGADKLTSYKYVVRGTGQVRP